MITTKISKFCKEILGKRTLLFNEMLDFILVFLALPAIFKKCNYSNFCVPKPSCALKPIYIF